MISKLTEEDINSAILSEQILKIGKKTTVILITLKNGYEVVGTSACVDPANYDEVIGTEYARKRAIDKVWELMGFTLQQVLFFDLHTKLHQQEMQQKERESK